jgi:hypothetical protein
MPKTPKKPLATVRFAEGGRNDPKKGLKAQKRALLRPKPLFGAKVAFGGKSAKKSEKCAKGENGLQNTKETIVKSKDGAMGTKLTLPTPKNAHFL